MVKKKYDEVSEIRGEFFPHTHLWTGAWGMIEQAKKEVEGSHYMYLASMLFSAFCLEAYLNYLGGQKVEFWQDIEKKLSVKEKRDLLCKLVDFKVDTGKRPFQTFKMIFDFRNDVAHAKPEILHGEGQLVRRGDEPQMPETKFDMVTLKNAQRFYDDTLAMIEELHKHLGLERSAFPFENYRMSGWDPSLKNED